MTLALKHNCSVHTAENLFSNYKYTARVISKIRYVCWYVLIILFRGSFHPPNPIIKIIMVIKVIKSLLILNSVGEDAIHEISSFRVLSHIQLFELVTSKSKSKQEPLWSAKKCPMETVIFERPAYSPRTCRCHWGYFPKGRWLGDLWREHLLSLTETRSLSADKGDEVEN